MDNHVRYHMHNKFVIVDKQVLLSGSFNWTAQAVYGNQENLAAIESPKLIELYQAEFDKIWEQFAEQRITADRAQAELEAYLERQRKS
jgi:cardiolipin hydrolase